MSGYSIGLYRYMRVDENIEKQKRLLESAPLIIGEDKSEPEEIERNKKFLCFGEFEWQSMDWRQADAFGLQHMPG